MDVRLDVFHHLGDSGPVLAKLNEVLALIRAQGALMTGKIEEITTLLTALDTATNAVAAEIDVLKTQIAGGLSADEANGVVARLTSASDRLRTLAADPADPVPIV